MPDKYKHLEEHDLAQITYDRTRANRRAEQTVKGEVTEIDRDPTGIANIRVRLDETGDNNQYIILTEGVREGERYADILRGTPFSRETKIGENAELEAL